MPTKRLTRQEKREKIRVDLIEAADDLFAERGYWGVSLDEIAERAGVTKGAVYSNFESKEDLLLAVTWLHRVEMDSAILGDPNIPLPDLLRKIGEEAARLASSDEMRRLAPRELELASLALVNDKIRDVLVSFGRLQREFIARFLDQRAEEQGFVLPMPAMEIAALLLALQRGLFQQRFLDPEAIPPDYFADAFGLLVPKTDRPKKNRPSG